VNKSIISSYPGIHRKVFHKTRIIRKFVLYQRLKGRVKVLQRTYVLQECLKNLIGLEVRYLTLIAESEKDNERYLDWYDVEWTNEQTTFLKCTECGNELSGSGSFISDDESGVKYKCTDCGRESVWNFDIFPIPVEMIDGKYPSPKEMECQKT